MSLKVPLRFKGGYMDSVSWWECGVVLVDLVGLDKLLWQVFETIIDRTCFSTLKRRGKTVEKTQWVKILDTQTQ